MKQFQLLPSLLVPAAPLLLSDSIKITYTIEEVATVCVSVRVVGCAAARVISRRSVRVARRDNKDWLVYLLCEWFSELTLRHLQESIREVLLP